MPKFWVESRKTVRLRRLVDYETVQDIKSALLAGNIKGEEPEEIEEGDINIYITPALLSYE